MTDPKEYKEIRQRLAALVEVVKADMPPCHDKVKKAEASAVAIIDDYKFIDTPDRRDLFADFRLAIGQVDFVAMFNDEGKKWYNIRNGKVSLIREADGGCTVAVQVGAHLAVFKDVAEMAGQLAGIEDDVYNLTEAVTKRKGDRP